MSFFWVTFSLLWGWPPESLLTLKFRVIVEAENHYLCTKNCQDQRLTWPHVAQVKRCSVSEGPALIQTQIIIYRHCIISQNCERPSFDLAVSFVHSLSGILGSPLLSLSSSRITLVFDMVAEPGRFRARLICYVLSRPVRSRRLDDATDESNHIIIRRGR